MVVPAALAEAVFEGAAPFRASRARILARPGRPQAASERVANDLACSWLQEVQARRLGAAELARKMLQVEKHAGIHLSSDGCRAIAQCFENEGDSGKAIQFYRRAVREDPASSEALNDLGAALGRTRQYRRSVRFLRQARDRAPRDPLILSNLGASLAQTGRTEEALALLDEAIALAPASPGPWHNKAIALLRLDRAAEALVCGRNAIRLGPKRPEPVEVEAVCLLKMSRFDEAADALSRAVGLGAAGPALHLTQAVAFAQSKRLREASEALRSLGADPRTLAFLAEPDISQALSDLRDYLAHASELSPLVDSLEIELPAEVNFADWEQLSAFLTAPTR